MTHEQALLQAVLDAPDDDVPRLLYADWLEDRGDEEHAEFIRLQVRLRDDSEYPGGPFSEIPMERPSDREFYDLRRREAELLSRYHAQWTPSIVIRLVDWIGYPGGHVAAAPWRFHRGFVDEVSCTCDVWLKHGPAVVAVQPVAKVRITDKKPWRSREGAFMWFVWPDEGVGISSEDDIPDSWAEFMSAPYDSEADALADLFQGALLWARSQVKREAVVPT